MHLFESLSIFAQQGDSLSATGAFWASVIAAIVAVFATTINYQIMRSQLDPHVIAYLKASKSRSHKILLVVENIGRGMAKDIKLRLSKPLPKTHTNKQNLPRIFEGNGVPAMGPGSARIFPLGYYDTLSDVMKDDIIYITVFFRTDWHGVFSPKEYEIVCPIELSSFQFSVPSDGVENRIADSLENISNYLTMRRNPLDL